MKIDKRRLAVSPAPHIRAEESTRSIMLDVVIALFFPLLIGIYFFGWRALVLTLISILSCVLSETLYCVMTKTRQTASDISAVVTGMILALCLPVSVPLWFPVVGGFFAIVIVKKLYGGIGKNFLNPALTARAFLFCWPAAMTLWTNPTLGTKSVPVFASISRSTLSPDVIASVTPLGKMKDGFLPSIVMSDADIVSSVRDIVVGNVAGCIGEVSALVIIASAIYLIVRRVITAHIPLAYVGTVAVLTFLFPKGNNPGLAWMLYSVFSGGLLFGAVFMATDYTTSPRTPLGRVLYGIGCGVLTVIIRYFGTHNEGVTYAILAMNCVACFMDRVVRPRRFGVSRPGKEGQKR